MIPGIVLAAGQSSRMGRPKAALRLPTGATFVDAVVQSLVAGGIPGVVVVAGAHPDAVRAAVTPGPAITVLHHPGWADGQLSSLLAGLEAVDAPGVEAVAVTLVDVPLVQPATIRTLVDAWRRSRAPVVRPALGDRHGHPVIFDRATFAALRAAPLEVGAKAVIAAVGPRVLNVATTDPGVLRDIDTPAEYDALLEGREGFDD
jgi:molybdenum cofactor cytidylyltransferase